MANRDGVAYTLDYTTAEKQGRGGWFYPLGVSEGGPPVVANVVLPTAPGEEFSFDVYDAAPGLRLVQVLIDLGNVRDRLVVYDEGAFRGRFAGLSTISGSGTSEDPYHFSVRPAGGWPAGVEHTLLPRFIDSAGNELVIP